MQQNSSEHHHESKASYGQTAGGAKPEDSSLSSGHSPILSKAFCSENPIRKRRVDVYHRSDESTYQHECRGLEPNQWLQSSRPFGECLIAG